MPNQPGTYPIGLNTTRALMALGDLVIGWLLLRLAAVAVEKLDGASPRDKAFYEGKVAAATWFAANVFPELTTRNAPGWRGPHATFRTGSHHGIRWTTW